MYHLKLYLDDQSVDQERMLFSSAADNQAEKNLIVVSSNDPPFLTVTTGSGRGSSVAKRVMDFGGSLALIVFLAPLMLLIALLISVSDKGPPIYLHRRVGRGGRTFRCIKFRTMCMDSEKRLEQLLLSSPDLREQWQCNHKLDRDPRVTRLGHLLRITSMDELPQLFNVLWGDMSLVGPRPIVAAELLKYGRYASCYFSVKPGITGMWQVSGRSATTYRRRVAADVYYARTRSLLLDLRILLYTIPAVLMGRGSC